MIWIFSSIDLYRFIVHMTVYIIDVYKNALEIVHNIINFKECISQMRITQKCPPMNVKMPSLIKMVQFNYDIQSLDREII